MAYKGLCVALLLSFFEHTGNAVYYVEDWNITHPPCILATPAILYTENGPEITESIPDGYVSLTVGYVHIPGAFDYIGCVLENSLPLPNRYLRIRSDPGECYSVCRGHSYFGIYKSRCYCLSELLRGTEKHCAQPCENLSGTVCGGEHGKNPLISVYKYVYQDSVYSDDGNNCRKHDVDLNFHWEACATELEGLCDGDSSLTSKKTWTWIEFTTECFKSDKYPAVETQLNFSKPFWIAKIKSRFIENINADSSDNGVLYGYIEKDGEKLRLRFTDKEKLPAPGLCRKDTEGMTSKRTTTTTPTTTTTTKSTPTTATTTTTKTETTSEPDTITTTTTETYTTTTTQTTKATTTGTSVTPAYARDKNRANGGTDTLVAAYVVVPTGVIAIAIAVILFVIRKKRICTKGPDSQYSDFNDNAKRPPTNLKTAVSNAAYESKITPQSLDTDDQRHDYFVLEAPNEYATIKEESITNSGEADYDTTDMKNDWKHAAPSDGNVYNTLVRQEEDTYNHTGNDGGNRIEGGESITDDTYNHVVEDDGYSTSAQSQIHQQHVDDTYNTLALK